MITYGWFAFWLLFVFLFGHYNGWKSAMNEVERCFKHCGGCSVNGTQYHAKQKDNK